jgi:hypothetical protein
VENAVAKEKLVRRKQKRHVERRGVNQGVEEDKYIIISLVIIYMPDSDSDSGSSNLSIDTAVDNLRDEMDAYLDWRDTTKQRLNTIEGRLDDLESASGDAASSGGTRRRRRKKRTRKRRKKKTKKKRKKRRRKKRTKRRK